MAIGISGAAGFGVPIPGPFVGGAVNVGITSTGHVFIQFQGSGMVGAGFFAGVGVGVGISHNKCETVSGVSTERALHVEVNAGAGEAAGGSVDIGNGSQAIGFPAPKIKAGEGAGVMIAGGISTTTTIASPRLW